MRSAHRRDGIGTTPSQTWTCDPGGSCAWCLRALGLLNRSAPAASAVVASLDPSLRGEAIEMLRDGAPFGAVDERHLGVRRVEEPVRTSSSSVRGSRETRAGPARARAMRPAKRSSLARNSLRSVMHADVMERHPDARRQLAHARQRALEILQVRPGVAVVRAEAGEVDVAEEEHVVRLGEQRAMSARVAGQMDRAHGGAAELEAARRRRTAARPGAARS